MNVDIFIRTYSKDIDWLHIALASIQRHVTGYRNIIITIPDKNLLSMLTIEKVIQVDDMQDGYIGQQLTKMEAWKYTDADAIVFWDSDVIACEPVDVSEWIKDGKPIIWKTKYELTQTPWRPITEKAVGFDVEWEYMRRMPLTYLRSTLVDCQAFIEGVHKRPLRNYLSSVPHRAFSEFNAIGAYAEKYLADQYHFQDTETGDLPKNKVRQFWSWGGLTDEVMAEIGTYRP
jgi:hypothetical protein